MTYREQDLVASIVDANRDKGPNLAGNTCVYVTIPILLWNKVMNIVDRYKDRSEILSIEESLCKGEQTQQITRPT